MATKEYIHGLKIEALPDYEPGPEPPPDPEPMKRRLTMEYREETASGEQVATEINELMDKLETWPALEPKPPESQTSIKWNNMPPPEVGPPIMLWSFGFEADEVLAVWAALRTYLRALANQESEDLEMLARIIKIMTQIRPSVVKASKALSLEAVEELRPPETRPH